MPVLDGTEPAGMGPRASWGRGFCNPYSHSGPRWRYWGYGRGFGWGRGRCWRYWATGPPRWWRWYPGSWDAYDYPEEPFYGTPYSPEDEMAMLREEADWLKDELDTIERRLSDLEAPSEDEGA